MSNDSNRLRFNARTLGWLTSSLLLACSASSAPTAATQTDTGNPSASEQKDLLPGQGGDASDGTCASVAKTATLQATPADIIVAVDTSQSMSQESDEVQANLNDFASIILGSNVDVHVVLISQDKVCVPPPLGAPTCPGDDNLPIYRHVPEVVTSNDSLQVILNTYPLWKDSLRSHASKTFLVVSDDNSELSASAFKNAILALDPPMFDGFKFDAIVAFDPPEACLNSQCAFGCGNCPSTCCIAAPFSCDTYSAAEGTVYKELVQQTGGVLGDLCQQEFAGVFADMADSVVEGVALSCEVIIPAPPEGQTLNPTKVNVGYTPGGNDTEETLPHVPGGFSACTDSGGWYYDNDTSPTTLLMCPSTCARLKSDSSGTLDVLFGCDTITTVPK